MSSLIPIYTTKGDSQAFLKSPNLFNRNGDCIGFVSSSGDVYSVLASMQAY